MGAGRPAWSKEGCMSKCRLGSEGSRGGCWGFSWWPWVGTPRVLACTDPGALKDKLLATGSPQTCFPSLHRSSSRPGESQAPTPSDCSAPGLLRRWSLPGCPSWHWGLWFTGCPGWELQLLLLLAILPYVPC